MALFGFTGLNVQPSLGRTGMPPRRKLLEMAFHYVASRWGGVPLWSYLALLACIAWKFFSCPAAGCLAWCALSLAGFK